MALRPRDGDGTLEAGKGTGSGRLQPRGKVIEVPNVENNIDICVEPDEGILAVLTMCS